MLSKFLKDNRDEILVLEEQEMKNLGFLAHELRNALSSATVAHEMIKAGIVGTAGSTAGVLEANLSRMRNLIDRSLSEVRMRANSDLSVEKFPLGELLDQVVITARMDAAKRHQTLNVDVDESITIETDRQFLLSAISNLVQNAIKYTKDRGSIALRASQRNKRIVVEIEDECGGIDLTKIASLFEPYSRGHRREAGLGLGLTITQRAVNLIEGKIRVENKPNCGCIFILDLPEKVIPGPSKRIAVAGRDSVQPNLPRRK